jgi:hypothetical protein
VAVPLLDSMAPAFGAPAEAGTKAFPRLSFVYCANGIWPMDKWTPKTEGAGFELTPFLEPLAPFKNQMTILTGLAHAEAAAMEGDAGGDHSCACASYLTGIRPRRRGDLGSGVSVDQVAAKELGKDTQVTSLELTLANTEVVGICEGEYSCTYTGALSWRNSSTPLPLEYSPRAVFERLFGDSDTTDKTARLTRIKQKRSLLDFVMQDTADLVKTIGPEDKHKVNQYLDAVRDIERRIQIAEEQSSREVPTLERPVGVPGTFEAFFKLMTDLQVVAFQADLTRVISMMLDREGPWGGRAYPEIGVDDLHHTISHHQNDPDKVAKLFQISLFHTKMFSYYLEKMRSTPDGNGNLLDRMTIVYGASLSNPNGHSHVGLPVLLAGGGSGKLKGGRHIRYADRTPMSNLYVTLLNQLGIPTEKFGGSTGSLDLNKA